jgi:hypothetical protein|tara:strand:- start:315 stop:662 length:348 start_codon:yes stop_codon:yes gene_type:complete
MATLIPGVYKWSYAKGEFEVHFVDGGDFLCPQFPRHSSWSQPTAGEVIVDWQSYGNYTLKLSSDCRSFEGHYTGHPEHWRKGQFLRAHTVEELAAVNAAMQAAHDAGKMGCSHHH